MNQNLKRFPLSSDMSLQAWSAADEFVLEHCSSSFESGSSVAVCHDRFGAIAVNLSSHAVTSIVDQSSHLEAITSNRNANGLSTENWSYVKLPLSDKLELDYGALIVPKSTELWAYYLNILASSMSTSGKVIAGFMTRNFTSSWLKVATLFFDHVEQSKAKKKARVITLKNPKKDVLPVQLSNLKKNDLGLELSQYPGVFSSGKIDMGTKLLLEHMPSLPNESSVLDLACGNGIVGAFLKKKQPNIHLHAHDNSHLALASAKLNLDNLNTSFYWGHDLSMLKKNSFDFIFINPPFHNEYENNTDAAKRLFKQSYPILNKAGSLYLVANKHLNYRTYLQKIYPNLMQVAENEKFEVIVCEK